MLKLLDGYFRDAGSACTALCRAKHGPQSAWGGTRDHSVKVLQPVHVLLGAGAAGEQEVHDDVGVVPEAVGGQKQLAPARAQRLQQLGQPRVLRSTSGMTHLPRAPTLGQIGSGIDHPGRERARYMHILTVCVEQSKCMG